MKVLFYRYGSICEPFLLHAFEVLGLQVAQIDVEISDKKLPASECVRLVSEELLRQSHDFVFTVNFFPAVSDVCNVFHIPYIGWTVDSPVMELYSTAIGNPWNYIFLFDRCQYEEISPLNPGHIFYLPLATDPDYMQSVIKKAAGQNRFFSDISFVGSLYTEKCAYDNLSELPAYISGFLRGIMEAQQKIYGYYFIEEVLTEPIIQCFKEHMPDYYAPADAPYLTDVAIIAQLYIGNKISSLERIALLRLLSERFSTKYSIDIYTRSDTRDISGIRNRGFARTLTEMPLIFHESTINLNMTSKSIRSGIPLRVWDIAGCCGFQITNFQSELPEYFVPGENIEFYESPEDLAEKCRYYLEHPARAREIAHNSLSLVEEHHTYRHRIEEMLRIVFLDL